MDNPGFPGHLEQVIGEVELTHYRGPVDLSSPAEFLDVVIGPVSAELRAADGELPTSAVSAVLSGSPPARSAAWLR
jgi:hypothetical protein